jgi:hypothetical protein
MTEITIMQTIFLVLKHPKNMHIKFLSISEVAAGKRHDFISNQGKPFAHWSKMAESTRDKQHNSSFFLINTPTITLTLHCSSTMVEGHEKLSDSNTTSTSSSASASASVVSADWDIAPPLWNVRIDTQYVGITEEQKQQI